MVTKNLRLIGYADYCKEEIIDFIEMLRATFTLCTEDSFISERLSQINEYLWSQLQAECPTEHTNIEDMAIAYFEKQK